MPDWITDYLTYTKGLPTPDIFRLWTAITAISGALERRVWAKTARSALYPNLYTLLVSPPGVGKTQAIDQTKELWFASRDLKVAPDSVSKASLIDALAQAKQSKMIAGGIVEYSTLVVPCGELGVLIPAHDLEFLSNLNNLFDNPRVYRETRRTNNLSIEIMHPSLVLLGGTQPGFMASMLPEEAWSMGTMSRMVMIYAGETPIVDLFNFNEEDSPEVKSRWDELLGGMKNMLKLYGQCQWTQEAMAELGRWYKLGCPPIPDHSKLQHYNARRIITTIKLAIISTVSRTAALVIELEDIERAKFWLLDAEDRMPDIFRMMTGRSDQQILQELHLFAWKYLTRTQKPSVPEAVLVHFLTSHAPADKIHKLLEIADRSGMLEKSAGSTNWIPKAKHLHGVE